MRENSASLRERAAPGANCLLIVVALLLSLTGCQRGPEPVVVSREALGTVVTVTAWGDDREALKEGIDAAFGEMDAVAGQLDAYDPASPVSVINNAPYEWHDLSPDVLEVLDRVDALEVGDSFSPALFGVSALYDFGGEGSVPSDGALDAAVRASGTLQRDGDRARFQPPAAASPTTASASPGTPGLDFGGAAKGLGLDRAMARLRRTPGISGALITTVSSTTAWGRKPDGEPWRIGVEDPRAPGSVIAVVTGDAGETINVSTSGDYQRSFERDGVRYHHILDPATGRPARGVRSLTVFGHLSGLDADILSTALFVRGEKAALAYARRSGLGVYLVDSDGGAASVPGDASDIRLEEQAGPRP